MLLAVSSVGCGLLATDSLALWHRRSICIIAGDISPIDVITHVPILCEEANVAYIYVPSKEALGAASATKRPTSCVLIVAKDDAPYAELYAKVLAKVEALAPIF